MAVLQIGLELASLETGIDATTDRWSKLKDKRKEKYTDREGESDGKMTTSVKTPVAAPT